MRRRMALPRQALVLSSLVATLNVGCGGADFAGAAGKGKSSDATSGGAGSGPENPPGDGNSNLPEPYAALTWYWQCSSDLTAAPKPSSDKEVVVENEGPHEFAPGALDGTPIVFSGHLCPPSELPRDIVFVIDTSGSNESEGTDPRRVATDGGCGRLDAVKQVIASIPVGQANFGLNTFSTFTDATSSGLFATEAELFANIAPAGNIADVVCAANGGTNYNAGLDQASRLLQGGRAAAVKEIYFVSDGKPSGLQNGVTLANTLKTVGVNINAGFIPVTIATVMLIGDDTEIKRLSSMDSNGQPLHATVTTADELTAVLTELSKNDIVAAEMQYRAIGATAYTTLDIIDHMTDFNFTLPSFSIDIAQAPTGIEVLFAYRDMHDNRYESGGKLVWQAVASTVAE